MPGARPVQLFGGLLLNNDSGAMIRSVSWLSFFHYAWEGLMVNELDGLQNLNFNPYGPVYETSFDTS